MNGGIGYAAVAIASGLLIPVMARLNGTLAATTGNVAWPALIICTGAFAGAALFTLLGRAGPPPGLMAQPAYHYGAGLIMGFYVIAITWLVPRFGIGPSIICVVGAQLVAAAMIDQFGLLGAPVRPLSATRAIGLVLLAAGVLLTARPPADGA